MIAVLGLLMIGVRASEIRHYPLDERSVYTIGLSREEPTTCVFPAPIKAIVGANVSAKIEDNPGILLSHEPGAEYFSLRPLKDGATGALNIVLRGKVYALAFVPRPEPDRAVVFLDEPVAGGTEPLSRGALAALLERAKQIERGGPALPGMVARFERTQPGTQTSYRAFVATIESVIRFEAEDALVFSVRLENRGDAIIPYDPDALAIRLDREFFPAALTDASGAIPPHGSSRFHLVLVGAPGGGRANLSVHAKYSVIVPHP
jgi:hypothetical protein